MYVKQLFRLIGVQCMKLAYVRSITPNRLTLRSVRVVFEQSPALVEIICFYTNMLLSTVAERLRTFMLPRVSTTDFKADTHVIF